MLLTKSQLQPWEPSPLEARPGPHDQALLEQLPHLPRLVVASAPDLYFRAVNTLQLSITNPFSKLTLVLSRLYSKSLTLQFPRPVVLLPRAVHNVNVTLSPTEAPLHQVRLYLEAELMLNSALFLRRVLVQDLAFTVNAQLAYLAEDLNPHWQRNRRLPLFNPGDQPLEIIIWTTLRLNIENHTYTTTHKSYKL